MIESVEPAKKTEMQKEKVNDHKSNSAGLKTSNDNQVISLFKTPSDLVQMANSVQKLRDDIIKRFEDQKCITLMMHVNLDTAKADLIPFPDKQNLEKFKNHFAELPKKVQNVVSKNIPEEDMLAVQSIWNLLDSEQSKHERTMTEDNRDNKAIQAASSKRKDRIMPYTRILAFGKEAKRRKND